MKKNIFLGLLIVLFGFGAASCDNKDDVQITDHPALIFELTTDVEENTPIIVVSEGAYKIAYKAENAKSFSYDKLPVGWEALVVEDGEESYIEITAAGHDAASEGGLFTLAIKAHGEGDQEITKEVEFYWIKSFDDPKGTFVLNEGNMTTENGSLVYITPEGMVIDHAYKLVNGTELGNVAQDMAIHDGKIYVISQNGDENAVGEKFDNDGMLVIMNAKTLKKERAFSKEELSVLTWPSHIAVLDAQHVYIRDNGQAEGDDGKGKIWRLDSETGTMSAVEGTESAPKSQMITMNGKVYTYKGGSIFSHIWEISKDVDTVNRIKFPSYWNSVSGIQAADDGALWVLVKDLGSYSIAKVDAATGKELVKKKKISVTPAAGTSGRPIVAKGNTVYYANETMVFSISFDEGKEEEGDELLVDLLELDSNARYFYNGVGVHPFTGNVFINTIKGVGPFFTTNQIWEFDFDSSKEVPVNKFEDYTSFPAGVFFPNQSITN